MIVNFDNALSFLLIMMRMTGMLVFHPVFGRSNTPRMLNAALAFILALLLVGKVPAPELSDPTLLAFALWVVKEMLVGLIAGFLMQMFFAALVVGGEMMDMLMGISMSKAFDPGSNTSLSLSAQIFNILFVLMFFTTNCHHTFIQMTAQSFYVLPMGSYLINFDAFYLIPQLLSNVLLLAVKLCIPMVVIELIVTIAVGIIMRIIPQINIFVINIQFKLIVGFLVLVMLVPSFTAFMGNLMAICVENIQAVWVEVIR